MWLGVKSIFFRKIQIYRLVVLVQGINAQNLDVIRIGMYRRLSTVTIFCPVIVSCISDRDRASDNQVSCLCVSNREVGARFRTLDGCFILIIVGSTSGEQGLRVLRSTFDGVENELEDVPASPGSPVSIALGLVIGDHVVVGLCSFRFQIRL